MAGDRFRRVTRIICLRTRETVLGTPVDANGYSQELCFESGEAELSDDPRTANPRVAS